MRLTFAKVVYSPWVPWALLGAGLIVSLFAAHVLKSRVEAEARLRFENDVMALGTTIQSRVWSSYDVLYGVQGLYRVAGMPSRADFHKYFSSLNLAARYPGFEVLSFSRYLRAEQLPAFEERVRRDTSLDTRGYPNFRVRPPGDRPEYYVVEYIEPIEQNANAIGIDILSDPIRAMALERARDSGQLVASGRIVFINNKQVGFSLRVPIYRNDLPLSTEKERRAAFVGVVSATFAAKKLIASVLATGTEDKIRIQIFDVGFFNVLADQDAAVGNNLIYDSVEQSAAPGAAPALAAPGPTGLTQKTKLNIGGRVWDTRFTELRGYTDQPEQLLPFATLAGGVLTTVLLFALVQSLAATSSRAIRLANKMTENLRESEEKLRTIADSLPALVSYIDTQEVYQFANRTYEAWFGIKCDEIVGRTMRELLGEEAYAKAKPHIEQVLAGHTTAYDRELVREAARYHLHNVYIPHFGPSREVLGFFVLATDISDRKALEDKLAHMAQHDALTGLPNRVLFEDRLHQALERSKRNKQPVAVMYLDVDYFKAVNDTLGHQVGDQLLKSFAARITQCVRAIDTVARLGGDEFTVLLEELTTREDAERVAQKIIASTQTAHDLNGTMVPARTSIGIAIAADGDVLPADLVAAADAALYQAKTHGRNNYRIAAC